MTRAGTRLGRLLGRTARALGVGPPAVRAAQRLLRRLDPTHPALAVVPDDPPSIASGRADLQLAPRACRCWSRADPSADCPVAAHRDAAARLRARGEQS